MTTSHLAYGVPPIKIKFLPYIYIYFFFNDYTSCVIRQGSCYNNDNNNKRPHITSVPLESHQNVNGPTLPRHKRADQQGSFNVGLNVCCYFGREGSRRIIQHSFFLNQERNMWHFLEADGVSVKREKISLACVKTKIKNHKCQVD